MFDVFDNEFGESGFNVNPARPTLADGGYDPTCYIATANLLPSPYTSRTLVQAKIGGLIKLIEACDDAVPPNGDLTGDALVVYNSVIQNVTTEINGYLSSIYPTPLAQTGTVAVLQVTEVSTDGLGKIVTVSVINKGSYLTAPSTPNAPNYLRYIDKLANVELYGPDWTQICQLGSGASLTVVFSQPNTIADENGNTASPYSISGTPTIAAAGTNYQVGDLLVLAGGTSFVPAKIRQAAVDLACHSFYQRRLAPDEKNPFSTLADMWRKMLMQTGNGELELDGTYKRSYSSGAAWGTKSVLYNSNSL